MSPLRRSERAGRPGDAGAGRAARGQRFLDPDVLARIDNLELLARTVVDGFLNGLHSSPYLGLSTDFAEHRSYMPGDDTRLIDWRLWGRTDRHYVKQFEAETNTDFTVLLDVTGSMGYGSGAMPKLDYARSLAACLSYFSRRQRDRVGLVSFHHDIVEYIPPSGRHLDRVLHALDRARAAGGRGSPEAPERADPDGDGERPPDGDAGDGGGPLEAPLLKAGEALRRSGVVAIVSDLYDEPAAVRAALRPLVARGHDVMVFHVLDPAELDLPFADVANIEDMESGQRIPMVPGRVRERYRDMMAAHLEELEAGLTRDRIDYTLLDTSKPLDHALHRYLVLRQARARKRAGGR